MPVDTTGASDLVVVVPGIMGSELHDREGRPVWSIERKSGTLTRAISTLGRSLKGLALEPGIGDDHPGDGIVATGLVPSLHVVPGLWSPISGYDGLVKFLESHRFDLHQASSRDPDFVPNLIAFPYDWRLSNRYNGRRLAEVAGRALERWRDQPGMGEAKIILVCHSMGGLVARWFAEQEGGAELIRAMVTIGTPHRGSVKAVETLVNGLEPRFGPFRLDLGDLVRSSPAVHQLLPTYACLQASPDAERVDLVSAGAPGLDSGMVADAAAFHRDLAMAPDYPLHKVVGIRQPTLTTAWIRDGEALVSNEIDGSSQGGDGTVPRLAAETEIGWGEDVVTVADQHGELQASTAVLDLIDGIITRQEVIRQGGPASSFGVEMDDLTPTGQPLRLRATDFADRQLQVSIRDEGGFPVGRSVPVRPDGTATLEPLPPGGYRAVVAPTAPGGPSPVTKLFVVLDPEGDPGDD